VRSLLKNEENALKMNKKFTNLSLEIELGYNEIEKFGRK